MRKSHGAKELFSSLLGVRCGFRARCGSILTRADRLPNETHYNVRAFRTGAELKTDYPCFSIGLSRSQYLGSWQCRLWVVHTREEASGKRARSGGRLPPAQFGLAAVLRDAYAGPHIRRHLVGRWKPNVDTRRLRRTQEAHPAPAAEQWQVVIREHHEGYIDYLPMKPIRHASPRTRGRGCRSQ